MRVAIYKHSGGKEKEINAVNTINTVRLPDLSEKLKTVRIVKNKIGQLIRR